MTVTAPPRPPRLDDRVEFDRASVEALEALIEEARRRARRRRIRYGVMTALATGTIAALLAIDGGSGGSRAFALGSPKPSTNPAGRALHSGGQLSVIGIPTSGRQQPTAKSDGWYGLSTIGRVGRCATSSAAQAR